VTGFHEPPRGFSDLPWQAEDLHAWHVLRPLLDAGGYLPWSTGSMRPAGLVVVCNAIVHGSRTRVVECGSGVSTVVLGRLLRERGDGSVTGVEHDGRWAALVRELLRREGLEQIARVVHAPLEGEPPWYARGALGALPDEVDLLVVDGPPACAAGEGDRRAPALPFFAPRLVAGATVVLDDVHRPGEREVIGRWEARTPWRFDVDEAAGVAVGAAATGDARA
jgi:hypothetical protein